MTQDINYEKITVQDCLDMYEKKNKSTIINNGEVCGFENN